MNLEIKDLSIYYTEGDKRRRIVENVNYNFEEGKMYAILGRSGSGKSSFLSAIKGKYPSDSIYIDDKQVSDFVDFRRNIISIINQDANLIDFLNAIDNVLISMEHVKGIDDKQKRNICQNILLDVGIAPEISRKKITKLSGGERHRVMLARAIALDNQYIIADEPTGNLDIETEKIIIDIMEKLVKKYNKTIIMATHSIDLAARCDKVLIIKNFGLEEYDGDL